MMKMQSEADSSTRRNPDFELPPGWRWVRLGEVVQEALPGFACGKRAGNDGFIQLRMNNISSRGELDLSSVLRVPATPEQVEKYRLAPGDIIFNNTNSAELVGKTALFTEEKGTFLYSNHLTRLRPKFGILDPFCLASWLRLLWYRRVFEIICNRWIGQAAVQREKLLNLEIPLAPFPEQLRIAAKLRELMQEVERARTVCEKQLEAAKILPATYLRQVFESEEAKKWERKRLGEVCEINPRRPKNFTRSPNAPTTFVPMAAVDERTGTIADPEVVPYSKVSKGYTYFEKRDVLFAKITPCMQNGKHVIARDLIDRVGFGTTEFHVLRPDSKILPEWVHFFIRQPHFLREATAYFTGAVGQQRVPEEFLANYTIPLPPVAAQRRIAADLREKIAQVEKLRTAIEKQLEAINTLPQAILRKAFKGEL
ncbi:MAG: Type-1 restriction enzyme EcoKI specificity protein [Actinobacteria bacterium]|nr:Type-1 restriction enzyme EcoKI specificity protein [Actinomycetota bacterium]